MKKTIVQAIRDVMKAENKPMTVSEVYDAINSAGLYRFKADRPVHVVMSQIRRHCQGLDFPSASKVKHFKMLQNGKYFLLESPISSLSQISKQSKRKNALITLKLLHNQYLDDFRRRVLDEIRKVDPSAFEQFCRNLLLAYGFQNVVVTRKSKDGGIDGHGRLKVGFAYFNVAFQCKRWTKGNVGRPEIDQFRGAIQGKYEQGIFFTTRNFTSDADNESFRNGAVPIVLVNGPTIVDIMIEKQFGIQTENLPIHSLFLDEALSDNT